MGVPKIPVLVESEPIYFDYNSTRLSAAAQKILARNAAWLTDNPVAAVMISGHTDEVGTRKNNYQLGMERAQAVRNFLQTLGVDEHRMMCRSFGEVQPLDTKTALDTWRRNRRVQFELVPPHGVL